jgi:hypothetical protein
VRKSKGRLVRVFPPLPVVRGSTPRGRERPLNGQRSTDKGSSRGSQISGDKPRNDQRRWCIPQLGARNHAIRCCGRNTLLAKAPTAFRKKVSNRPPNKMKPNQPAPTKILLLNIKDSRPSEKAPMDRPIRSGFATLEYEDEIEYEQKAREEYDSVAASAAPFLL